LYHPAVRVLFQPKAWTDDKLCKDWADKIFYHGRGIIHYIEVECCVDRTEEVILFCDNLHGQITPEFKKTIEDGNAIVYHGPANTTDRWQPIDAGVGKMLKTRVYQYYDEYMVEHGDEWDNPKSKTLSGISTTLLICIS